LKETGKDFRKDLENISKHFQNFCRKYDVSLAEAMAVLSQSRQGQKKNNQDAIPDSIEKTIPLEIFLIDELGYFESLVRYLKDNRNITIKEQSKILNRSTGALWASYYSSNKKFKKTLDDDLLKSFSEKLIARLTKARPDLVSKKESFRVPIDLISGRKFSPFQSVVIFLRTYFNMRFTDISIILGKDMHSVWNAANSAKLGSAESLGSAEDTVSEIVSDENKVANNIANNDVKNTTNNITISTKEKKR